jgi:polysaccharide biosynthesis protein PslJ
LSPQSGGVPGQRQAPSDAPSTAEPGTPPAGTRIVAGGPGGSRPRRPAHPSGTEAPLPPLLPVRWPEWDTVTVLTWYAVALFLVPASLIFHPLGASGTPATVIGLLMLVWWGFARAVPHVGGAHGLQPVRWAVLLFAVGVLLSYVGMAMDYRLPVEVTGADRGMLNLLSWAGVALVTADGIRTRARLEKLLERVVLLAAVIAVIGAIQFFFGIDIAARISLPGLQPNGELTSLAERSTLRRVGGTASHPIEFGVVLAAILPIALHFAVGRGPAGLERSRKKKQRDWICLALIALGAFLSVSRSATLAIAAVLLVVFAGWPMRWRVQGTMWLPILLVGLRLAIPGLVGTIIALFESFDQDPSISGRTDDYSEVADRFATAPWIGQGFNTFVPPLYRILDNQYLVQLITGGVIGVVTLIGLFLTGWCCARGARWRSPEFGERDLAQALAASMLALALTYGTFDALSFPMVASLTFFLLGCAGALWRLAREEHGIRPARAGRLARMAGAGGTAAGRTAAGGTAAGRSVPAGNGSVPASNGPGAGGAGGGQAATGPVSRAAGGTVPGPATPRE